MSLGYQETIAASTGNSTALTNTVTPGSILIATSKPVLAAQFFGFSGKKLRVTVRGRISSLASAILTLDCRLGSTVVFNGGAMTLNATAQTNATFKLTFDLDAVTVGSGATATLLGSGEFISRAVVGSAAAGVGGAGTLLLPDTAPAVGTGFDSTTPQTLDVFGTWNTASASNSIQGHISFVESPN